MSDDITHRSTDIHWPEGFAPESADMFVHNEVFIMAPMWDVWRHLIEAEKWPNWYPNSHDVRILDDDSGTLGPGTRFAWETFGQHLESQVHEFESDVRIGWFGEGSDLTSYHSWLLVPESDGCRVITEEAGNGAAAASISESGTVHSGHDLWLGRLRDLSEGNPPAPVGGR